MKVVEIFSSIDGEGKRAGELTTFIRLWGCNLRCKWCDTDYSYNEEEGKQPYTEMSITQIINRCVDFKTTNITVTGGEPLIHDDIGYLLEALSDKEFNVNVETNGSVPILPYFDDDGIVKSKFKNVWFTIDYKCGSSGMTNYMCIDNFNSKINAYYDTVYKFVVGSIKDLDEAREIINKYILVPESRGSISKYIYLSPVFGDIEPKQIVEYMQEHNMECRYTPIRVQLQLHKFIWPVEQRGV